MLSREIAKPDGGNATYEIPISTYSTNSEVLLVNSPGSWELKDGREGRWQAIWKHLQELGICTFVTYNAPRPDFEVQREWEPYSYKGVS